ncbi:uncharacterized protein [Setaria viridis]|uniref:uncharacterized protein isoform X2 n=1 Tax=Setaria viridis TaxID=4556 RepID=UPI003B3A732A
MIKVSHVYNRILEDLAVPGHNHKHGSAAPVSIQEVEAALQNFQMAPTPTDGTGDTVGLHSVSTAPVSVQEVDAALQDLQVHLHGLEQEFSPTSPILDSAHCSTLLRSDPLHDEQMAPAPTDGTYGMARPQGGAEGGATNINSRTVTTQGGQDNTVVSTLFTRPEQVLQVPPTEVHDEDQNQQQQQKVTKIRHP